MSRSPAKAGPYGSGFLAAVSRGLDRLVGTIAPVSGARRLAARMTMSMASDFFSSEGGYDAADRRSREMGSWTPFPSDADSSILTGLDDIRARTRDACRNQPLAGGVINTTLMNTVGTGLAPHACIDRDILGLSEEAAAAWQKMVDWRWWLWAGSKNCDLERRLTFNGHTRLALRSRCVDGESLTLLPVKPLMGLANPIRLQAIEADRLSNPGRAPDSAGLVGGVEKDGDGAPVRYHIMRGHPGNILYADPNRWAWDPYPAFNPATGLPNVIHYFRVERPGQTRGVSMLAPILEPLKDLARMTKAELKRAVVSALFTVFLKGANGQGMGNMPPGFGGPVQYPGGMSVSAGAGDQSAATTGNIKLGYGAVVDLGDTAQDVVLADPKLPNVNFDPFWLSVVRQIGLQTGIPCEVLIKHYTASYSAARAAIEDAFRFFLFLRAEMIEDWCDPIRSAWFAQEVAQGTIPAPGFFADPLIRAAWLNCTWSGPTKPILDPVKEVEAASQRSGLGITTLTQETAEMNGGDWESNIEQRGREERKRRQEMPAPEVTPSSSAVPAPAPAEPNPDRPDKEDEA